MRRSLQWSRWKLIVAWMRVAVVKIAIMLEMYFVSKIYRICYCGV